MLSALLGVFLVLTGSTLATSTTLPPELLDAVPRCAQDCLVDFVLSSFDCSALDLGCLCVTLSFAGFTIAEGALGCIAADCPRRDMLGYEAQVSGVCTDSFSKPPSTTASTTPPFPTLTDPFPTMSTVSANPTTTFLTVTSTDVYNSASGRSTTPTTTVLSTIGAVAATTSGAPPRVILSGGQIAGVAVGVVIAALIAISLVLFLCFFGDKNGTRRDSDASFYTKHVPANDLDVEEGHNLPAAPAMAHQIKPNSAGPKAHHLLGIPGPPIRPGFGRRSPPFTLGGVSIPRAAGPFHDSSHEASPTSIRSYHTTSGLLPDKPVLQLPPFAPQPLGRPSIRRKPIQHAQGVGIRVISPTPPGSSSTDSTGEGLKHSESVRDNVRRQDGETQPPLRKKPSDPFLTSAGGRVREPERRNTLRASLPRINTTVIYPSSEGGSVHANSSRTLQPPPAFVLPGPAPSAVYSLPPGPGVQGRQSCRPQGSRPPGPSQQFSKYAPLPSRGPRSAKGSIRPETHYTTSSETSFEDDDDACPPAELSALSPVVELPTPAAERATGLANIRYPQVPWPSPPPPHAPTAAAPSPMPARPPPAVRWDRRPDPGLGADRRQRGPKPVRQMPAVVPSLDVDKALPPVPDALPLRGGAWDGTRTRHGAVVPAVASWRLPSDRAVRAGPERAWDPRAHWYEG